MQICKVPPSTVWSKRTRNLTDRQNRRCKRCHCKQNIHKYTLIKSVMASSLSKSIQLNTRLLNALKHHISQSYELDLSHTCTRMFRCFLGFITLLSDHFPGTVFVLLFDLFRCADGLCFCIRLSQQYHKIVW